MSERRKRTSSADQIRAVVCSRCHDYRQQIARLESSVEREAAMRLAAERRAKALAEEIDQLRRDIAGGAV